jgi:hypothetical protein
VGCSIIDTPTIETSTFVFIVPLLDGEIDYTVFLKDSIQGEVNGVRADLVDAGGYEWSFKTSDKLDLTPPKVRSVLPMNESPDRGGPYGRNIAIQMTFDEPMDPTAVSGVFTSVLGDGSEFNNIVVTGPAPTVIDGVFALSNGYRTVTYLTFDECGTNSCGQSIFCLPDSQPIDVLIKSPNPLSEASPIAAYPAYGATDVVGNALDGNADGQVLLSEDDALDDYTWGFSTNDEIVLSGPGIVSGGPSIPGRDDVALDVPVEIVFNDYLLASSLLSQSIYFTALSGHDLWFTKRLEETDSDTHKIEIPHGVLVESTDDGANRQDYVLMGVELIQNIYQNCLSPAAGPNAVAPYCNYTKAGFEQTAQSATCCIPTATKPYCCDGGGSMGEPQETACITRL